MKIYHKTYAADKILTEGFRDTTGTYLTSQEFSGVWVSNRPLDEDEGAKGNQLLQMEISEQLIVEHEWIEDGKPYREFLVPAELLNNETAPIIVEDDLLA